MAENIQGNPININVPANVTVTQGKTNLSTLKKQLAAAEAEMQREAKRSLTSLERSDLKDKILQAAHAQRQELGLSLYGNASSYSMKKFANEPNPSNVKEYLANVVKPKGVVGARGGALDKEIMGTEREIAFILKSMKMPLPKGTTGIAAQQQSEVKNMSRIFNKVKKDEALEIDVQKFYQSAANLKALYEKDVSTGGMSKKAYLGRIKELESLSTKFEARAKVSRHEYNPLTAVGRSLVKGPIISATKQLQTINKAVTQATVATMAGAGGPQALAKQAAADIARNEALGKAAVKKAVKQSAVLQSKLLGASFGGDTTNLARAFDLQALAIPNIKKSLANKLAKEMRKAGITNLTTAGGGGTPIDLNPPSGGGSGGGGGGFSGAGAAAISMLKDKLVQFAGFASGMLLKAISTPLTLAFGQIKQSVTDAFKEGPEMLADMTRMAVPLAIRTGEWKSAMDDVEGVFRKVMGDSIILPNEIAKIAFSYTRVAKETKGLVGYLKEISLLHSFTQESLQTIDDMVLEWAQAFNIDIPNGAAKIAGSMTAISAMTDVSITELRQISAWLTPIFAQQRDAEKALREEMALSGLLAQRGSKLPIMVRSMQGAISQLQTPSSSMIGLFASMNLQIYKMKDGTTGWSNTYKEAGKQLKLLYERQHNLNKAAAGGTAGPEWVAANKAVNEQIKQQEEYLGGMFSTWQDGGLIVDDTLGALSELSKLMENPGTQARFLKELKGSSRDAFFQLLKTVEEARKLAEFTKSSGGDVNAIIKAKLEGTSIYQAQRATAGKKLLFNTLESQLIEPLRLPFFKAFADLFDKWNKDTKFKSAIKGMGKVIGAIGQQYIVPAVQDIGTLIEGAFSGDDASTAAASERLKLLVTGFLGRIAKIAAPIITPIGELVGNLFMIGFMSVLNSDFIKQVGSILVTAGKQLIVGLYEQAGGAGKSLINALFPFAGKIDEVKRQVGEYRKALNISPEKMAELYQKYKENPGLDGLSTLSTSLGGDTMLASGLRDLFDQMIEEGLTIDSMTGNVALVNTALEAMQESLKNTTLSLNGLSTSAITAKNNLEAATKQTPTDKKLKEVAAQLAGEEAKPAYGTPAWHEKYRGVSSTLSSNPTYGSEEWSKLFVDRKLSSDAILMKAFSDYAQSVEDNSVSIAAFLEEQTDGIRRRLRDVTANSGGKL